MKHFMISDRILFGFLLLLSTTVWPVREEIEEPDTFKFQGLIKLVEQEMSSEEFSLGSNLIINQEENNDQEDKLSCPECKEKCQNESHLAFHMLLNHKNTETMCPYKKCDNFFNNLHEWYNHVKNDHKPNQCPLCLTEFLKKTALTTHMFTEHEGTAFPCPHKDCHLWFTSFEHWEKHIKTPHEDFFCRECGCKFKNKINFVMHTLLPGHEDSDYYCPYYQCTFNADKKEMLVRHIKEMHLSECKDTPNKNFTYPESGWTDFWNFLNSEEFEIDNTDDPDLYKKTLKKRYLEALKNKRKNKI